jgi:hypothetical protein
MLRYHLSIAALISLAGLASAATPLGSSASVGCVANPRQVERLEITKPGTYENYLVDSRWQGGNRVKITAGDVVLRHCEIRNATGNGIGVFAPNVVIEDCKIHHLLAASFDKQTDAHGITGHPRHLVVRNSEIAYVSGDAMQFDPDRQEWDDVLVEHCTFLTGPLESDAGGFKSGQRPGENAFDSKTPPTGKRPKITFRNCVFHGWSQPGQIDMLAALNVKENVECTVERCLFYDNQVALRLRGPGARGGALVHIKDCAIYDSQVGVRMEDRIENLTIEGLLFGPGVDRKYQQTDRGPWPGYRNTGEGVAPPLEQLRANGFGR